MYESLYDIDEFDAADLTQRASEYLIRYYESLWHIMKELEDVRWTPLTINFLEMLNADQQLGMLMLSHPKKTQKIFETSLIQVQQEIIERSPPDLPLSIKNKIIIRWSQFPINPEITKTTLPKSHDVNRLVAIHGTVVRVNSPKMIEWELTYACQKCGGNFVETADIESFDMQTPPSYCKANHSVPCQSKYFSVVSTTSSFNCRDYQEIKIQEQVHQLGLGAMPKFIICVLMDDLVGLCHPGDDVTICGIVTHRWGPVIPGEKPEIELILIANHVSINNEQKSDSSLSTDQTNAFGGAVTDELQQEFESFWEENELQPLIARNLIVQSICPEVFGMYIVKLAVILVLAGGVRRVTSSTAIRGESHLLMIGDPGTGKSQILKFASKLAMRSVLTTGSGTTGAGLTAAAVKEKGTGWTLEAGALVLADGGACCIDEFSSIQPEDQTAIHEAMEQQSLHIAKAGLVCTLHTRCSVIAATNPRGKYDTQESVSINVALGGPLLSRFDLVLVMLDQIDENWDKIVSDFILDERGQEPMKNTDDMPHQVMATRTSDGTEQMDPRGENFVYGSGENLDIWPVEKLRAYIAWIRATFHPKVSHECQQVLKAYYHRQRQSDGKDASRTTVRLLESLIRLTQGHAKIMARDVCHVMDAVVAIYVMEMSVFRASLNDIPTIPSTTTVRSVFSKEPEQEYLEIEKHMLGKLGLIHLSTCINPDETKNESEQFTSDDYEGKKLPVVPLVNSNQRIPTTDHLDRERIKKWQQSQSQPFSENDHLSCPLSSRHDYSLQDPSKIHQDHQPSQKSQQIPASQLCRHSPSSISHDQAHLGYLNQSHENFVALDASVDISQTQYEEYSQHSAWSQNNRH